MWVLEQFIRHVLDGDGKLTTLEALCDEVRPRLLAASQ